MVSAVSDLTTTWIAATLGAGLAAWVAWPRTGVLARWRRLRECARRVLPEDALKHAHDCEYRGAACTLESTAGVLSVSVDRAARLVSGLEEMGLLRAGSGALELTPQGRMHALRVIRVHRLWERFLADETGVPQTDWHTLADRIEHHLPPDAVKALARRMGDPRFDPHGDPIPTEAGEMPRPEGIPLASLPIGEVAKVMHVEDEPATMYAQLVAIGVHPGMQVRMLEATDRLVRFELEGEPCVLAPLLARNISVAALREGEQARMSSGTLSSLALGEVGRVERISRACHSRQRRRLMDLGIVPGTEIRAELRNLAGDLVGYRIRGATVALRKQQAELIHVRREREEGR